MKLVFSVICIALNKETSITSSTSFKTSSCRSLEKCCVFKRTDNGRDNSPLLFVVSSPEIYSTLNKIHPCKRNDSSVYISVDTINAITSRYKYQKFPIYEKHFTCPKRICIDILYFPLRRVEKKRS